ncbi:hypothetical protein NL676_014107 [Syzygium grande]|nr:hypothetical protein NL676_014107 [Syzygium grande]
MDLEVAVIGRFSFALAMAGGRPRRCPDLGGRRGSFTSPLFVFPWSIHTAKDEGLCRGCGPASEGARVASGRGGDGSPCCRPRSAAEFLGFSA